MIVFAGAGSTLAAAEAIGYASIGIELDRDYVEIARRGIPALAAIEVGPKPKVRIPEGTGGRGRRRDAQQHGNDGQAPRLHGLAYAA